MDRLRTHIARITTIAIVWMGFSLYLVQTVQAEQSSNAFARWLNTKANLSGGADLQEELNGLLQSGARLDKVIEQASRFVSKNNEDFDFPFTESTASGQIYQLLLIEWNQFQTGNEMAGVPMQQSSKVLAPLKLDHIPWNSLAAGNQLKNFFYSKEEQGITHFYIASVSLIPMADGIAIGAP